MQTSRFFDEMPVETRPAKPSWSVPPSVIDEDHPSIVKIELDGSSDDRPVAFAHIRPEGTRKNEEPFLVNLGFVEAILGLDLRAKSEERATEIHLRLGGGGVATPAPLTTG